MAAVVRGLGSAPRSLARGLDEVGSSLSYRETRESVGGHDLGK